MKSEPYFSSVFFYFYCTTVLFSEMHIDKNQEVSKNVKLEQYWNRAKTLKWNVIIHFLNIVAILDEIK